ncbi:MAG TPA: NAD(P)H-dependent oxidoreductase subunit E [Fimbriiglobus sp.]|nr:NAD(P)H-dependent oxidoreductase subunit E [Fimbriiglobus sp.]
MGVGVVVVYHHVTMRLIPLLTAAQETHGHLSEPVLRDLARAANVPLHRLQQLVSFYPHFRTAPPPRVELAVCRDVACHLAGIPKLQELHGGDVAVQEVSCVGRCDRAPAGLLNGTPVHLGGVDAVKRWVTGEAPAFALPPPQRWALDPYPDERYGAVRTLRDDPAGADRVIAELKASGLRGMGGAGFPTGTKWELVRQEQRTPKYVICNADESEPGTFKDAKLLADAPHLVIEGMLIAGQVVGAAKGILFLRHEYLPEKARFDAALADAPLGGFEIEVFVSPGGYILGEETALLECLEDRRGEPRNKPPFPGTHGLFNQPTLINNVETFANVPGIVANGADWWRALGTDGCPGPKLIAVSGHVEKPGVYQVPLGTTVRQLIELAGGVSGGRKLLAFAPGGASSNWLPADRADVRLDFNELAKAGSMLGSGALVIVAEGADMLEVAANVTRFFRNESCGKCVPCRVGSEKAVEMLESRKSLDVLPELGEVMALTSICGLGQVAVAPALSILKHWPELREG